MRFNGHTWRRSNTIVNLPSTGNFIAFGRICKWSDKGAIKTNHTWQDHYPRMEALRGEACYAKPLPISGHSLTNMAYGKPTYRNRCAGAFKDYRMPMYLMCGGFLYTASYGCGKEVYDRSVAEAAIPDFIIKENPRQEIANG